ncbi:hypothetical protein niasHT_037492 [Heterodera trifolii]|uniref:Uncharacterized protein n=1 Tax=Heterodera trifolii TaxID=157864 RepID=A0ABD2ILR4_9BILA
MKFSLLLLKGKINLNTHRWFRRVWQKCYSWPQFSSEKCTECPPPIVTDQAVINQVRSAHDKILLMDPYEYPESMVIPYEKFDLFVSDIDEDKLMKMGSVNKRVRTEHLSAGRFSWRPYPARGIIYGPNNRFMVPLPCQRDRRNSQIINVWFMVATGSPYTTLTKKTCETIFEGENLEDLPRFFRLRILDRKFVNECYVSKPHFEQVNILGNDFLSRMDLSPIAIWDKKEFFLVRYPTPKYFSFPFFNY